MSFVLAHFSDVHLGPVHFSEVFSDFSPKRILGGLSWLNRRGHHRPQIANALRDDIHNFTPDHIAFTGDLVNLASTGEFKRGLDWLKTVEQGELLTFVPGNHDDYVARDFPTGLSQFADYQSLAAPQPTSHATYRDAFPFVRLRRNVAVIGVNSSLPQGLTSAAGTIGEKQMALIADRLQDLGRRGFYRAVMIHHPPLPGLTKERKALTDAAALADVFKKHGVELVLHGHNHIDMVTKLETSSGIAKIIGVPSASMEIGKHYPPAQWNRYFISRGKGQWQTRLVRRIWNGSGFVDGEGGSEGVEL
jgi:3',5'-cyclic AMP phosphodiesterase CpdA